MVQGKLDTLIGKPSGYIASLPPVVKRRIEGLKGIQQEHAKIENEFQLEILELEKKVSLGGIQTPIENEKAQPLLPLSHALPISSPLVTLLSTLVDPTLSLVKPSLPTRKSPPVKLPTLMRRKRKTRLVSPSWTSRLKTPMTSRVSPSSG
jgi:hypothetical protein